MPTIKIFTFPSFRLKPEPKPIKKIKHKKYLTKIKFVLQNDTKFLPLIRGKGQNLNPLRDSYDHRGRFYRASAYQSK